jgi:enoyl-CoA hydratase/carnithine racemase
MLETQDHGAVRELRLARPPVNAFGCALVTGLSQAIEVAEQQAAADGSIRALVLSGAPGIFSAGLDVREVTGSTETALALVQAFFTLQQRLARCSLPIVAALTGHCPAGGTVVALLCDQRVMAAGDFQIGLNEVQVGLYPGETIFRVYERVIGPARAAEMLGRGAMVNPAKALSIGLVDEVVDGSAVREVALARAQEYARLPPQTAARTRAMVRADLVRIYDAPRESLESLLADGWVTAETRAAMLAALSGSRR